MKKSLYTEEQIVGILKESEVGRPTAELCRKLTSGSFRSSLRKGTNRVSPHNVVSVRFPPYRQMP